MGNEESGDRLLVLRPLKRYPPKVQLTGKETEMVRFKINPWAMFGLLQQSQTKGSLSNHCLQLTMHLIILIVRTVYITSVITCISNGE